MHIGNDFFFPYTYLARQRRTAWVMPAGRVTVVLMVRANSCWAPQARHWPEGFPIYPALHSYGGDYTIIFFLLMKERDTGRLMGNDYLYDRHVSRQRHLSFVVRKMDPLWGSGGGRALCIQLYLAAATGHWSHHLRHGHRQKLTVVL